MFDSDSSTNVSAASYSSGSNKSYTGLRVRRGQPSVDSLLDRHLGYPIGHRYQIRRPLGSGGMATVYLARDSWHCRDVAVKVLHPERACTLAADRFLREIQVTVSLRHPHILTLLDSGEFDDVLYYVMPLADGGSLRDSLRLGRRSTIGDALPIIQQLASALQYAHGQSVVHRDIKPGNILFQRGRPMLTDFGIALALGAASERRLTKSGYSPGTPAYMSPEQARGERDIDARADQYSLACVVFEMLVGEPPFTGTPQAVMSRHAKEQPPSARILRPDVSQSLEHVLRRALAKDREARFESIDSFTRALLGSVRQPGRSVVSAPLSPSRRLYRSTPLGRSASLAGRWVPRWVQQLLHHPAA